MILSEKPEKIQAKKLNKKKRGIKIKIIREGFQSSFYFEKKSAPLPRETLRPTHKKIVKKDLLASSARKT